MSASAPALLIRYAYLIGIAADFDRYFDPFVQRLVRKEYSLELADLGLGSSLALRGLSTTQQLQDEAMHLETTSTRTSTHYARTYAPPHHYGHHHP